MDGEREANWMTVWNSEEEVRRMLEGPACARQAEAELKELEAALEMRKMHLRKERRPEDSALTPKRNGVYAVEISALTPWKKRG